MANKTCPSCGADVPAAAARCKHCFHDFTEVPVKKSNPLIGLLIFVLVLLAIGAGTFGYIYHFQQVERVVVDEETHSVVFTRKSASGMETERVSFDSIVKVEHVVGGEESMFEVVAVAADGKRYIIQESPNTPLRGRAEQVASVMDKPLEEIKNIRGFGE